MVTLFEVYIAVMLTGIAVMLILILVGVLNMVAWLNHHD